MNLIDGIFRDVQRRFIWTPDLVKFGKEEDWRSYAEEVKRGEVVEDDCDAHAITCADLAVERGVAKKRVRVAKCLTEEGRRVAVPPEFDHLVCLIDDDGDGFTMVLDCRQRSALPWNRVPYLWHSFRRLSDPRGPDGRLIWHPMRVGDPAVAPVEIAQPVAPVPIAPVPALSKNEARLAKVDAILATSKFGGG